MQAQDLENDELVRVIINLEGAIEQLNSDKGRAEMELQRRMELDGATELLHPTHEVRLDTTNRYDQGVLTGLFELIPMAELERAHAYIPEHEEVKTVTAKFNMLNIRPFLRRGKDVRDLIDDAKIPSVRLSIKPKKENG